MDEEAMKNYKKAKEISDNVLGYAKKMDFTGKKILSIAEELENVIYSLGGKPAWPVNISINEIAAHYTPVKDDPIALKEGDLVKIDIGVHVNGYIWDQAFTVCVGNKTHPLIEASKKAVEEALKIVKPGIKIHEISEVIENTVTNSGFNVVRNLTGHSLEKYVIHAEPSIPNVKNNIQTALKEGQVIAIEVFVTNGSGWVKESKPSVIYQYATDKAVRMWEARKVLDMSKTKFEKLPFTPRWIKDISQFRLDMALRQLVDVGAIITHPPLKEESNGLVAQTETTVIIK